MLSQEGFEMIESIVCLLFQVIDVFSSSHVVLECYNEECCFADRCSGCTVLS